MSNQRQIGIASAAYGADQDDHIVPVRTLGAGTISKLLEPYLGPMHAVGWAQDVLYCPTNEALGSPPPTGFVNGANHNYKGFSGYFIGYRVNAQAHVDTGTIPFPRRFGDFPRASQTVSLCDFQTRSTHTGGPPTSSMSIANQFVPTSGSYILGTIHNGQTGNILFLDGHSESFKAIRLPVCSTPGQQAPWN